MYDLYIANKNYSSWSLRPWVLMRELGIAVNCSTNGLTFGVAPNVDECRHLSASRRAGGPG